VARVSRRRASEQKAVALNPELHLAWNNLGVALFQLGQREAALDAWAQAVAIEPRLWDAVELVRGAALGLRPRRGSAAPLRRQGAADALRARHRAGAATPLGAGRMTRLPAAMLGDRRAGGEGCRCGPEGEQARRNAGGVDLDRHPARRPPPAWGYRGVETPAIGALRRDGISIPAPMRTPALPSHTSLFTGLLPGDHGVRDNVDYSLGRRGSWHQVLSAADAERGGLLDRRGGLRPRAARPHRPLCRLRLLETPSGSRAAPAWAASAAGTETLARARRK
jgi:hypothetical protein